MASQHNRRTWYLWLAATGFSTLGWWFGTGLQPWWWLTWLAPIPVLWLAPRCRTSMAASAAFLAYAIGGLNQWHYLHDLIGVPMTTITMVIVGPAVVCMLATLLYRRLLCHGYILPAVLAPAALWVIVEYINSLTSPHGTFGSIAYTQMNALPVIQIAAVTGIWGITFWLWMLPAAVTAQTFRTAHGKRWLAAVVPSLLTMVALGYGGWRLQAPAPTSVRVGLASLEEPIRPALDSAKGNALQLRYLEAIETLADAGATIVVTPETSFATANTTLSAFAALADARNLTLLVGIDSKADPSIEHNMSMVFQAHTPTPITYNKQHLIPGFEDQYTPGTNAVMLAGSPRVGLAICKDMDFHDIGADYAARGAQLLLVPAWDFTVDGWLHSRMAIMRGVESGFAIARAARSGRLTLSDDRGRVLAESSSEHDDAQVIGDLPLRSSHTMYARWGDWFAWLSLVGLCTLLALAWSSKRKLRG